MSWKEHLISMLLMPSACSSGALARTLHECPIDSDVLAEKIRTVQLVPGGQSLFVGLVLDEGVTLKKSYEQEGYNNHEQQVM